VTRMVKLTEHAALRAGPPAHRASVLSHSPCDLLAAFCLLLQTAGRIAVRLLLFHLLFHPKAADRARVVYDESSNYFAILLLTELLVRQLSTQLASGG
jgi:hypothetical protein